MLLNHHVIEDEYCVSLRYLYNFRNRLGHDYEDINSQEIFDNINLFVSIYKYFIMRILPKYI
jgi:uncharacterized protein YutE (UPF0331/DUF86 family)